MAAAPVHLAEVVDHARQPVHRGDFVLALQLDEFAEILLGLVQALLVEQHLPVHGPRRKHGVVLRVEERRPLFEQLARRQPVLLAMEDWHWVDQSSVAL